MTPRDLTLMATSDDDQIGDETPAVEPEPTHAELHARLKLSVELVKMNRRVTELERQVEQQRQLLNQIVTRAVVDGRPFTAPDANTQANAPRGESSGREGTIPRHSN